MRVINMRVINMRVINMRVINMRVINMHVINMRVINTRVPGITPKLMLLIIIYVFLIICHQFCIVLLNNLINPGHNTKMRPGY